jgi:uncharacterized protein YgiM (DUF1202 family)
MVGDVMAKLLALLVLGMYLAMQLGGNDPGQLRPGLATAVTEPAQPVTIVAPVETRKLASDGSSTDGSAAPIIETAAADRLLVAPESAKAPAPEVVAVAYSPEPEPVAPQPQADSVFTLSALPGQTAATRDVPSAAEPDNPPAEQQIVYVTGRSVNVREAPSTDAPVIGKLLLGDAALKLADNGAGWAQITIEGDGMTGYVSMDFLSPNAP